MWLAQIDPRRSAASLTEEELVRLQAAIVKVLNEGIDLRGTQRDLFGAHTYERIDKPELGFIHSEWLK